MVETFFRVMVELSMLLDLRCANWEISLGGPTYRGREPNQIGSRWKDSQRATMRFFAAEKLNQGLSRIVCQPPSKTE